LLYILDEDVHSGEDSLDDVAAGILRINKLNIDFYIDSAVPLTKRELNKRGVHAVAVKKFQDSINAGIIWLQSLQGIMICKQNTPFTYKEFKEYEYELDKYEEVTNKLQDKNNHSIDAVRYANLDNIRFE
jgi:phage terminase large subunit